MPIFGERKGGYIDRGDEKLVFRKKGKRSPFDYVIKEGVSESAAPVLEWEKKPNYIKAEFYLSKLLHLLFPDYIPDYYSVSVASPTLISTHEYVESSDGENGEPRFNNEFVRELVMMGIAIDTNPRNFIKGKNNDKYVDRIKPWIVSGGQVKLNFEFHKLENAITLIEDDKNQVKAKKYLERLKYFARKELDG